MQIFKYLKKYKKECILAPLLKMLEAIFELLVPLVIKDIVDNSIPSGNKTRLIISFVLLVMFSIFGFIFALIAQYYSAKVATLYGRDVKNGLLEKIESLSYQELDEIGSSTLLTRMSLDILEQQTGVNMFLRLFLRSPFVVFGALIMGLIVNIKMGITFVIVIPSLLLFVFAILLISIPIYKKIQAKNDVLLKRTEENVTGVRVLRAFNQNEDEEFEKENIDLLRRQKLGGLISSFLNPITYLLINLAIIFIIKIGFGVALKGEVVAEYNYMSQILIELIKLANLTITLSKAYASAKRCNEILKYESSINFVDETIKTEAVADSVIKFENVSFKFKNNKQNTLSNISFEIKKGESVGIIGLIASGKSTLINLIPRLYEANEGNIYINGIDIKNYSKTDIRNISSIVLQKPCLFADTIKENITLGKDYSNEEVLKALEVAQGLEILDKKELGLDEAVLSNGKNFSGGEQARIMLARSIISNPEILIIDDATSSLDYLTESKLKEAINNLENKPTLIIVSQRISAIKNLDKIILLDKGKTSAIGTHEELLNNCKLYQDIFSSQTEMEGKENE